MISAKVIHGDGIGKELGFPTANLDIREFDCDFELGVFSASAWLLGEKYLASVTIIKNPKFKFEVHVLNYSGEDFYGEILQVEVKEKISSLKKFKNKEELIEKIEKDLSAISLISHKS